MNHVLDDKGNRIEGLSKEEMLAVLQQAIDNGNLTGIDTDSAFVSKLKCCVGGETHYMGFVTQAKYNELKTNGQLIKNAIYFITDDTTAEEFENNIIELQKDIEEIYKMPMAEVTQDENDVLKKDENSIPQYKPLFKNNKGYIISVADNASDDTWFNIETDETLKQGDIIKVVAGIGENPQRAIVSEVCLVNVYAQSVQRGEYGNEADYFQVRLTNNILKVSSATYVNSSGGKVKNSLTLYAVYKVIY